MKTENDSSKMVAVQLLTWQAVLEFLGRGHRSNNFTDQVLITKNENTWTVQTNGVDQKQKPITLTTKNRGVGLFDLNW